MNKVMDLESDHILAVLEDTVAALEAIATLPESCRDGAFVGAKPKLSDAVVKTLERHQDKGVRDTLRKATATTVSLPFAAFTQTWTELIIHVDHVVSTSTEQDERTASTLRESKLRLREIGDDCKQVAFELTKERETRVAMHLKYTKCIADLQEQLKETKRAARDAFTAMERNREQELHAALSSFENQKTNATEKMLAVQRTETRVSDENKQFEADERKRKQRIGTELYDLLQRYDTEMTRVDDAIAQEQSELQRIENATNSLVAYFARVDEDRRNQLDELRAIDDAERRRRQRELNLFQFIQKLQALVRGFLVRHQYRLELQLLAHKRKRKAKRKTKHNATKKTSTSPTKKKTSATLPMKKKISATPSSSTTTTSSSTKSAARGKR
uniref:Dynein regulatory complex protein 10 n=1 Tax=Globisporangium ultimum (strain ATCC 200006 / CBS 805.95 / DAOM BR144) TaxID=431595 RepID=K3WDQ4_GLOUD